MPLYITLSKNPLTTVHIHFLKSNILDSKMKNLQSYSTNHENHNLQIPTLIFLGLTIHKMCTFKVVCDAFIRSFRWGKIYIEKIVYNQREW